MPPAADAQKVHTSYSYPVTCTLEFDEDVVDFTPYGLQKAPETLILNFVEIRKSKYQFQVASTINANVSIYIAAQTVRNVLGHANNESTAYFDFYFYAFAPSVSVRLDEIGRAHV